MASNMVKEEWDYALVNDKSLIPVRLRPTKIPSCYVRLNYVDCVNNEQIGFEALRRALQSPKTVGSKWEPPTTIEWSKRHVTNRAAMLNKVHDFWIKGVLEPAKLGDMWLDLPAEQRPEAVEPQVKRELRNPDFDTFSLSKDKKIVDVFRRMGNALVILGAPGSGKTIALLELARDLIIQAQQDNTLPIPVVLNLASWAEKHFETLEDWLIERLFLDYGVPRRLGVLWIENSTLLFLFDGLDEVSEDYRNACVTAINAFWHRYDQIDNGIVVCSRIADYESLTTTLHLGNAIILNALTPEQANNYLSNLGKRFEELRIAIPADNVLRAFAESPLLLNFMVVAYRDTPHDQIIGLTEADQKRQLFDRYVARRLREGTASDKYPNTKTRQYLRWLAKKMAKHRQIIFQIEGLQPDWLDLERQLQEYRISLWVVGLVVGLFGALTGALGFGLNSGLLGALFGALTGELVGGLIGGLVGGLVSALAGTVVYELVDNLIFVQFFNKQVYTLFHAIADVLTGVLFGMLIGRLVVVLFGGPK